MKCLCCGKEIKNNNSSWHTSCIKKFFHTTKLPILDFKDFEFQINELGESLVSNNKSVTGVQRKLSLHLSKDNNLLRLTLIGYPQGYILKPNSNEFPFIAEAEHLVMSMAKECGINTTLHALIDVCGRYSYITKRVDREENDKIHMEDFCQLSLRPTEYKYNGSYEKCAKIIDKFSSNAMLDKVELFLRIVFCYITGNSDMHLKNFSLIEKNDNVSLSPAYDLLPVKMLINDEEELALTLNGKKKNITKNDLFIFAENIGINYKVANNLISFLVKKEEHLIFMIEESLLPDEIKKSFTEYICAKINILK